MEWTRTLQLASYLGQAAGSAVVAAVLWGFYRVYRRDFHRQWALSWWALTAYLLGSSLSYVLIARQPLDPLRFAVAWLTLVAGYWQLAWLLLGAWELATGRLVRARSGRLLLAALAAAALVAALIFTGADQETWRLFVRVHLRSLFAGLAFLAAARGLVMVRAPRLVTVGFLLYGCEHLHYFAIGSVSSFQPAAVSDYVFYLGFVDLFLVLLMAVGLILWILAEERQRVLEAAHQIDYLAGYDQLTGLPNARTFEDRLELALPVARQAGASLGVLLLDLDHFKTINASLGPAFGDQLLQAVARRLDHALDAGELVSRRSVDDFLVLLPGLGSRDQAEGIAAKLVREIRRPFRLHGQELFVTASIGVAVFPEHGTEPETLIQGAGTALHLAKESGGDTERCFQPALNRRAAERLEMEHGLRRALRGHELVLHYQPIIEARSGALLAVEALVRWQHPDRGLLGPHEFMPLAATIGVIEEIDHWVLTEALTQLRAWRQIGWPSLRMAVNLSATQFQHPHLLARLEYQLRRTDVPASLLTLEVTETAAMQDPERSLTVMQQLKRLGVRIVIDDFGTGYSSLSHLRHLPVDGVKIDRSFVKDLTIDPDAAALVDGILALARTLRLDVVAEGVETDEQRDELRLQGCAEMQGFLFSRPCPAADFEHLLAEPPWAGDTDPEAISA